MSAAERIERVRESDGLAHTLSVLRSRWLLVVGVVAACTLVAIVRHERAAKSYAATSSVAFQSATLPDAALQVSPVSSSDPQRAADTEVLIAHSPQVAEGVRKELHTREDARELLKAVSVEAAPNAEVLNIIATTGDPRYSAKLANSFSDRYIAFKVSTQVQGIEAAEGRLKQQIAGLPVGSSARKSLEESQQRLGGLRAVAGGGASVIGLAKPPTAPTGMGLVTTAIVGIVIGLALAFAIVFLLESLDRRVKTTEEFERGYGLPVLTGIPQSSFVPHSAADREALLEPYRILRSALDFSAIARELDTLLITSAISGEGKTTVAVDLAHAQALTGRRVVLVELDLRQPTFAVHFGLAPADGLTTALARGESAFGLLVQPLSGLPNLSVLPAGRIPHNPAELLGTPRLDEILTELADGDAMVIIDAPPLNPVADAQILLNHPSIHAVLVVARAGKTTREEVRRARAILDHHAIDPVGLVVTGLQDTSRYGYDGYRALGTPENVVDTLSRPVSGSTSRRQAT
jgi:succinoglycan biosynthesis transport protein ExoP